MSDRCTVTMVVAVTQSPLVEGIMGRADESRELHPESPPLAGCVELTYHDCNYGGEADRLTLAGAGVTFWGNHTADDEYPAELFVSFGGFMNTCEMNHQGEPCCRVNEGGHAYPDIAHCYQGKLTDAKESIN